jgi:hypothetical protein
MTTYVYFELSKFRPVILAFPQRLSVANPLKRVPYGVLDLATASHRRNYTPDDAQAVCDWLNQRVEYHRNLRFHAPAPPLGPELDSAAVPATIDPLDGGCGVSSASPSGTPATGADDLEGEEITLSDQELAEAALLTSRESC